MLRADHFGNLILDASHEQLAALGLRLGAALTVEFAGERHRARYASTFADVAAGELLLYEDGERMAALAINRGSAVATLGVERDDELLLRAA